MTSKDSHQHSRAATGAIKVTSWIMFDDWYDAVIQLFENPDHQPKQVISLEEMEKLEKKQGKIMKSVSIIFLRKVLLMFSQADF